MSYPGFLKDKDRNYKATGAAVTVGIHLLAALFLATTGLKALNQNPPAATIELQFDKDAQKDLNKLAEEKRVLDIQAGNEPRSEHPNPDKEIKLVQRSESAIIGKKASNGRETTMGDKGDYDRYEAPRSKPIDKRALFPSAGTGDSLAPTLSSKISKSLTPGHPEGNTRSGSIEGEPSARLAGRSLMGSLPSPEYTENTSGKVVVKISVDQYGTVIAASPGASGTTVQNKTLWEAAKRAALRAKFNLSSSAPPVQEGTITYIFKLR